MKKILIIRFSSIGDIVLTTPVIRCVKKQFPEAELHYLTKFSFAGIVRNNPYVDKVFGLEDSLDEILQLLKKESYDLVIDLHHNIRSARVKSALGKPSGSFNKLNIEKWLLVNLKINRLPKTHIVDRYMKAAPIPGLVYDGEGLDYFIPAVDEVNVNSLPLPFSNGYVAFVIGAKHATKRLPPEKIIELVNIINLPVVLLGGKEDESVALQISKACGDNVFNGCGNYNLNQSASLVKQAKLVITHDTGLMHIAAAFRQKIISVWGNTVPEFGMYPFLPFGKGESLIVEHKHLSCRPCSKIGYDKCPKIHFKCMKELDLKVIAEKANAWWVANA